jgi:hypothetical protein
MEVVAWIVIGVVVVSLVALLAMARRRAWNVDGSDDERRDQGERRD